MKGCLRFSIFIFWVSPNLANIIMNDFLGKKKLCHKFPIYKKKFTKRLNFLLPQIVTMAYNMKGCLRFSTFIFWISSNLAKYTYKWIYVTNSFFFKSQKTNFLIAKNCHNCLRYKRVLKIFYFHSFYIAKYLAKYTFIWSPLEQHHKIEKNTNAH
jgi:hypothetical protein